MRRRHLLFILLAWLLSASAGAQTLLLIPGFQEQGMDWRFRQVSEGLKAAGWQDGGNLHWTPQGVTNTSGVYAAGQLSARGLQVIMDQQRHAGLRKVVHLPRRINLAGLAAR